jgi:hypothetical protein
MAIRDKVAAFLGQMGANVSPALNQVGGKAAQVGANVAQVGANVLADAGDAAFRQGRLLGAVTPVLSGASNAMHAGSQALGNMGQAGQTALGASLLGAGALGLGAAGAAVAYGNKKRKERVAGQNLGAQLGVQMPIVY